MKFGIGKTIRETENAGGDLNPCPFCGADPEWVVVDGWDLIMRCMSCHASTKQARQGMKEAKEDWNAGEIVDDNYSITADTKIDEFLSYNIKEILFNEYTPQTPFPETDNGFLCSDIVIVTDDIILNIEDDFEYLHYSELSDHGEGYVFLPVAKCECNIRFLESSYANDRLTSLTLQCGDNILTITADKNEECLSVQSRYKVKSINRLAEK